MVEGAYKKLKSYLFYDKTLLFSKRRLARFESNKEYFNYKIEKIRSEEETRNEFNDMHTYEINQKRC